MNPLRVKITMDGSGPQGVKVVNAETGEPIGIVYKLELSASVNNPVQCTIHRYILTGDTVEATVDAEVIQVCPCCKRPLPE